VEIFACGLRDASNKKLLRPKPASYPLAYVANSAKPSSSTRSPWAPLQRRYRTYPEAKDRPPLEVKSAWNVQPSSVRRTGALATTPPVKPNSKTNPSAPPTTRIERITSDCPGPTSPTGTGSRS
jgi:hypothetical protein